LTDSREEEYQARLFRTRKKERVIYVPALLVKVYGCISGWGKRALALPESSAEQNIGFVDHE